MTGKLTAFAGFGALSDLDLQFIGVDQVMRRHAKTSGCNLFNGATARIATGQWNEARFVFAAFACIGTATNAIHCNRNRFMRFGADGAERHRSGSEALDDLRSRLYFFDRNRWRCESKLDQAAQRAKLFVLFIYGRRVLLERRIIFLPDSVLQRADRLRIQQMMLAVNTKKIVAADGQLRFRF